MEAKMETPVTQYTTEQFQKQKQDPPGLATKMNPVPDCGEDTYKGHARLMGRKCLITGGDSGIGRACVIAFLREGADVCINYLPTEQKDADDLKTFMEKEIKSGQAEMKNRKFELIPGNLRDENFCKKLVEDCKQKLGGLDTIVLNAGRQTTRDCVTQITTDQLRETFDVNVFSLFHLMKAALPHLKTGSTVITTSSIEAYNPSPFLVDFACSQASVVAFTEGLAKQVAPKGIRVNCVAPGWIWTPLQVSGGYPQDKLPTFGQNTPLHRAGQPAELAGMYVYLASNESTYCTGDVFPVTGGKHL